MAVPDDGRDAMSRDPQARSARIAMARRCEYGLRVSQGRSAIMTASQFSIYRIIDAMRRRPGMYIGDPTTEKLDVFLTGYRVAMDHAGIADESQPPFMGFHNWVARKFGFRESTAGWSNMILAVTLGLDPSSVHWERYAAQATGEQQEEAVQRCFVLFDEYRATCSID